MKNLPADPLDGSSIAEFGIRLRRGEISAEFATEQYLARIAMLEPRLSAFSHVARERALGAARGIDRLLASGTDLGPLMGVPIAVKDLFTVDGMPLPRLGSNLDVSDLIEPEGSFIKRLKRAGCVILGKTRMTEFAFGLVNLIQKPPWNPWDAKIHRMPGGSSSGSAVALAAGLCAFSVGSDTGGSVRQPAALCGLFGLKPTFGLWPTDGVFPVSTTFDTIGTFTASARDAALVYAVLCERPIPEPRPLKGLRLGRPTNHFSETLSSEVQKCTAYALETLRGAGAEIIPIAIPETAEIDTVFFPILPAELLAHLGVERVAAAKELLDPLFWSRIETAFNYSASDYIRLRSRQRALRQIAVDRMRGLDGWVTPTTLDTPVPVADCDNLEKVVAWTRRGINNTRPGNLFGQCGSSIPIQMLAESLPVGLQIMCNPEQDAELLSISQGIENLIGRSPRPNVSGFL